MRKERIKKPGYNFGYQMSINTKEVYTFDVDDLLKHV